MIRRAGPGDDFAALHALIAAAFANMDGRIDPPSSLHRMSVADLAAAARDHEVWALEEGGAPVACVTLIAKPRALYVSKLAVAPGRQGGGLGRAMIALAEDRARGLGLPALELQTRIELLENHAAFAAMGFRVTGESAHPAMTARPR